MSGVKKSIVTTGADNFTGTTGYDTFTADNTGTDTTSTADTVNGEAGTDTINIFSDGAAAGLPALTSIETMNIYDQDADFTIRNACHFYRFWDDFEPHHDGWYCYSVF